MSLLLLLILSPVIAAIAVLAGSPARVTALVSSAFNLLITLFLFFTYDQAAGGFQFVWGFPVVDSLDLKFLVGADGLSLAMLLLTAIVTLAAIRIAPEIKDSKPAYFASLLFISAGAVGAFASLDIFFLYIFHELALIPTFLLIGIWGSGERFAAAWKITIYLALGSFVLLVGLVALYWAMPLGERTFDLTILLANAPTIASEDQGWIYLIILVGCGILVSLFPFHTWAPQAYACAPVPAAMLHAGVLKKFGLYALMRIAVPLLPEGAAQYTDLLLILLIGNVLYVGMVTIAQKRLDTMLGYSSVMHMGYIFLGVAALNPTGFGGATLLMVGHGLTIALLFAICGEVNKRTGTLEFSELGGLAKSAPVLGLLFGLGAFASIGLPGFANFAGEMLVFFGAFGAEAMAAGTTGPAISGFNTLQIATLLALWGLVISAIYMLRAYKSIFMGEFSSRCGGASDLAKKHHWPMLLLVVALLVFGFYPNALLNLVNPALEVLLLAR